ncbi:MAG: ECF transporter S component, partial [Clostridia bacterium]|nr:ECF transporter S component [Clostridia bacterium]
MKTNVNRMVKLGMLAALSLLLIFTIRFPLLPAAPFMEYEPGDVPILIGTFIFGPGAGLAITAAVSAIQAFTVSAGSGWIGGIMHMIATGTMVVVVGLLHRRNNSLPGTIFALVMGSLAMVMVMIPLNLFFTTLFLNVPRETVLAMLLPVVIPFNIIKAGINSTLT